MINKDEGNCGKLKVELLILLEIHVQDIKDSVKENIFNISYSNLFNVKMKIQKFWIYIQELDRLELSVYPEAINVTFVENDITATKF